jgi:hypothetical protein
MTKGELEIRLQVAENVIKETMYLLGDEHKNNIMKENSDMDCHTVNAYAVGASMAKLEFYCEKAKNAVERNGRDIHTIHNISNIDMSNEIENEIYELEP